MKTGVPSALHVIISNLAIFVCFLPVLFLASRNIRRVAAFRIIGLYWLLNALVDLFNLDISQYFLNTMLRDKLSHWYNLLDTPLILLAYALAVAGKHKRVLLSIMMAYFITELLILGWKGYDYLYAVMVCGAGPVLIIVTSIAGLIQYLRKMEHSKLENTMVFVYAAQLFAYASFLLNFVVLPANSSNYRDSFLLYYISVLLSVAVTVMGLWSYGLRSRPYSSSSS